jgi:hypothetical protein
MILGSHRTLAYRTCARPPCLQHTVSLHLPLISVLSSEQDNSRARTMDPPPLRVAVTQLECEWLDLERSIEKTVKAFAEAAKNSAKFVVFPECWIPGYPAWI